MSRGSDADEAEVIGCLSAAHQAADHEGWLRAFASPDLAVVTVTVTEAGYLRGPDGGLDTRRPEVAADIDALRTSLAAEVRTAPARLVAGLAARRGAGAGPVAVVPCDNVQENGAMAERVLADLAGLVDQGLADWMGQSVSMVTTVVDRITPRPGPDDSRAALAATGFEDRCPVVTEPFAEWVLSDAFPAGRPHWESSGARITADTGPFERRKLWLLNGAHSLLAYAGSILGHATVAGAVADDTCLGWLEDWWAVAAGHLDRPAARQPPTSAPCSGGSATPGSTTSSPGSRRTAHRSCRSGSCPCCGRNERPAACRLPPAATLALAAWLCHLRGLGAPVSDVLAEEIMPLAAGPLATAVPRLLRWLGPDFDEDRQLAALVTDQCEQLARGAAPQLRAR